MPQPDPSRSIAELLEQDKRYAFEAYVLVFESLDHAHRVLGMGQVEPSEDPAGSGKSREASEDATASESGGERHLSGRDLCEAIRHYALEQYGYMARCVLNSWGVYSTSDFGEIVYNLIRIEQMRKTAKDRREDFDDVYDFETAFERNFEISFPKP